MTIFNDVMPLLEHKTPIFTTPDVMELMLSLQDFVDYAEDSGLDVPEQQIRAIRLALVKDVANVLVADGTGLMNS